MADLIDRQAVLDICQDAREEGEADVRVIIHRIRMLPTVDAVEVVRCKDCVHGIKDDGGLCHCILGAEYDEVTDMYFGFNAWYTEDFFCAHGERRADDG